MKTSKLIVLALLGAIASAGCGTTEDDTGAADLAHTEKAQDDDDDFVVLDRMGRPEMTNVTIGAGLVRLKVMKGAFAAAKAEAEKAQADATIPQEKKTELAAKAQALGAELQRLAGELGAPESEELKSALAKDAVIAADEARQIEEAKRANQPIPTFPRRPSGFFNAYNHQHTFHPKAGERADAKRMLAAAIRALDGVSIDGTTPDPQDWSEAEIAKVVEILSEDALIVDVTGDCDHNTQSYFAIEREAIDPAPAKKKSCGGRTLNDDIIDDTLTMWIKKSFDFEPGNTKRVGDNVIAVTAAGTAGPYALSPAIVKFPYLGEPRPSPFIGAGACSGKCRTAPVVRSSVLPSQSSSDG